MKNVLLIGIVFFFGTFVYGQKCSKDHGHFQKANNSLSDSIDILHYTLNLDVTDFSGKTISGVAEISLKAKVDGLNSIPLDLSALTVSAVEANGFPLNYTHNDELLLISIPTLNTGETLLLNITYGGSPILDPSTWGGWYWTGVYAFNLGVGFESYPHNFGRSWYPCVDNFVERATYTFHITTTSNKKAICNGLLTNTTDNGNGTTSFSWELKEEIPTYLSCVAVGPYTETIQQFTSALTANVIPMHLTAAGGDMQNMINSFANLENAMFAFEDAFGPYHWEKVGFHLVPFGSGAMEHATAIAYPQNSADGGLGSETLMAHELSHHWWGNLVTCRTAQDMWINEGMASFSERVFTESLYGWDAYIRDIKNNHMDVLRYAHVADGAFYALHEVPEAVTYGDHSYNKGADVAHSLRFHMGSDSFYSSMNTFLQNNKFKDVDAFDMRDQLSTISGGDLSAFFDGWIFKPGFPALYIDSTEWKTNGGNYDVILYNRQKTRAAPNEFNDIHIEASFLKPDWTLHHESIQHDGDWDSDTVSLNVEVIPNFVFLNGQDKLSQATTGEHLIHYATNAKTLDYAFFRIDPISNPDSIFFRVDHHWVAPDALDGLPDGIEIGQDRFWSVRMLANHEIECEARMYFNGQNVSTGRLDTTLLNFPNFDENQLVVLYRPGAGTPWTVDYNVELRTFSSTTDAYGFFDLFDLKSGQYTFGFNTGSSVNEWAQKAEKLSIFPNPSSDYIHFSDLGNRPSEIEIFTLDGKLVSSFETTGNPKHDVSDLTPGAYFVIVKNGSTRHSGTFIKE